MALHREDWLALLLRWVFGKKPKPRDVITDVLTAEEQRRKDQEDAKKEQDK